MARERAHLSLVPPVADRPLVERDRESVINEARLHVAHAVRLLATLDDEAQRVSWLLEDATSFLSPDYPTEVVARVEL